jgi:NOL1/NOP2/fmu family ribosome biogenesis protein
MEKKKYEVTVAFEMPAVAHAVGEVIELTDSEAVTFGESVKLAEQQ